MLLLLRRGYAVGTFHLGLPSDRPQPDKEPTNPSYLPRAFPPAPDCKSSNVILPTESG